LTNNIRLELPKEIANQLDLGSESYRDISALAIAMDCLDVTASVITVTSLRQQLPELASSIRSWITRRPRDAEPVRMQVKGNDFQFSLELPRNVQTAQIIGAIEKLLATTADAPESIAEPKGPTD
jgi:hypothetical protein